MRFSVIIPTHNRNDLLKISLGSVLNQLYRLWEIIIVDDLSNAETEKCVKNISEKNNTNIRYIKSTSTNGVSHSYNMGSSIATGDYLAFLDDDDYWDKNYLQIVAGIITEQKVDIVLTILTQFNEKGEYTLYKVPPDNYRVEDFYLKNPGVIRSNFVVRKEKFYEVNGYDESILGSSDKELFMRLKKIGCKHYVVKKRLVFWRTHSNYQASTNPERMLKNVIRFNKKYFNEMSLYYKAQMIFKISRLYLKGKIRQLSTK